MSPTPPPVRRLPLAPRGALPAATTQPSRTRSAPVGTTYLRVVVTARCPLACSYCHREGDPAGAGPAGGLPTPVLEALLACAVDAGVRKLKLVGGEPLARPDLPALIASVRRRSGAVDVSLVTSGAVPSSRLDAAYAAGLSRCNVTLHGFGAEAFAERGGDRRLYAARSTLLDAAIARGRPLKVNYVYSGVRCDDDLGALLDWAAPRPVVVGVLDDLTRHDLGPAAVDGALQRLRGTPSRRFVQPDPDSLPTTHLVWHDGLEVEIKDHLLGEAAPWRACRACAARPNCREGIAALRLTHRGVLRPCMLRQDVGVDLASALARGGPSAALTAWRAYVSSEAG